jgi:hypothetical protein
VTCRHVVVEAGAGALFGLTKPRKTKNPPGGYKPIFLGSPTFHPLDDSHGTFDIAVIPLVHVNRQTLLADEIVPVDLNKKGSVAMVVLNGQKLCASGYPIDYAEAMLKKNLDEPLFPKIVQGVAQNLSLTALQQQGFNAPLREGLFAQITGEDTSGKGTSGGIVCAGENDLFAGIVLGSADIEVVSDDQHRGRLRGFIFAGAERVIETLQSARA